MIEPSPEIHTNAGAVPCFQIIYADRWISGEQARAFIGPRIFFIFIYSSAGCITLGEIWPQEGDAERICACYNLRMQSSEIQTEEFETMSASGPETPNARKGKEPKEKTCIAEEKANSG